MSLRTSFLCIFYHFPLAKPKSNRQSHAYDMMTYWIPYSWISFLTFIVFNQTVDQSSGRVQRSSLCLSRTALSFENSDTRSKCWSWIKWSDLQKLFSLQSNVSCWYYVRQGVPSAWIESVCWEVLTFCQSTSSESWQESPLVFGCQLESNSCQIGYTFVSPLGRKLLCNMLGCIFN